jgi:FkbM family methyltransferase
MLKIRFPSDYNQNVSYNALSGLTLKDKLLLSILKMYYRSLRLKARGLRKARLVLGDKERKNLHSPSKIYFMDLVAKFVGQGNMIVCEVPKYGYKSYCRTWNNFSDFGQMTRHEDDILQLFRPIKGDIVVDVGAHLGRYTLTSSNLVGKSGRVVAIEGDPSHYEILKKNLKLNKVSNVTAINCMVGSKDMHITQLEFLDMYITYQEYLEKGGTDKPQLGNTIIHVNSLDNLLIKQHGISEVNWMKIDVEGAELDVLKGAYNILSNSKRINLLIEIHGVNKLYKPIVEVLDSHNFKIIFEKDDPSYRCGDRIGSKYVMVQKFDR